MNLNINWKASFLTVLTVIILAACTKTYKENDLGLDRQLENVDSLISSGNREAAIKILKTISPESYQNNHDKVSYYLLYAVAQEQNYPEALKFSAKALQLFDNPAIIKEESQLYFKTLVTNGDINYGSKNYLTAFNYYVEAKALLKPDDCKNGFVFGKLANIFFDQKNYETAAEYYLKSYRLTESCNAKGKLKTDYFFPGMSLNNAGFCFFKAGQLDSAAFYYQKFEDQIDTAFAKNKINKNYFSTLNAILYDNLGGLYLQKNEFNKAEQFLKKCLAQNTLDDHSIKLPPNLKLAELYTKSGEPKKALASFKTAQTLLDFSNRRFFTYKSIWQKEYAAYFKKYNQLDSAYYYQSQYLQSLDSLAAANQEILSLNFTKELNLLKQRQELNELRHNLQVRRIYVVALIEFLALIIIIIVLVYRNLKKVRRLHINAVESNRLTAATVEELERANKNYIRIMRVMAHDLRNPLSGMAGIASVLLYDDELDEDSKKMLKLIETTGLHSIEMINELLKTGLADEDAPIEVQKLDLQALLFDSGELLQFKANEKRQKIIFEDNDAEPVFAMVNYEKVWRVINNLVVNAIKFSLIGGTIKIGVKEYGASVVVYVKDNGIGIAEKDQDKVFDMFTEAKRAGTNGEQPFGLGLSISKKIMEKHKGKIWFEPNPEGGTIFYLEFPKA
ncbi:MAG TPA: tetratricopeptide repeat-containing sensor histidine kinase [Pelobium sp.]